MLDVLKNIDNPENLSEEHLTSAYNIVKKYCDENDTDVLTLVSNDKNIKPASEEIYKNLPWLVKKFINAEKIENLILVNIDFIREKAKHFHTLENATTTPSVTEKTESKESKPKTKSKKK